MSLSDRPNLSRVGALVLAVLFVAPHVAHADLASQLIRQAEQIIAESPLPLSREKAAQLLQPALLLSADMDSELARLKKSRLEQEKQVASRLTSAVQLFFDKDVREVAPLSFPRKRLKELRDVRFKVWDLARSKLIPIFEDILEQIRNGSLSAEEGRKQISYIEIKLKSSSVMVTNPAWRVFSNAIEDYRLFAVGPASMGEGISLPPQNFLSTFRAPSGDIHSDEVESKHYRTQIETAVASGQAVREAMFRPEFELTRDLALVRKVSSNAKQAVDSPLSNAEMKALILDEMGSSFESLDKGIEGAGHFIFSPPQSDYTSSHTSRAKELFPPIYAKIIQATQEGKILPDQAITLIRKTEHILTGQLGTRHQINLGFWKTFARGMGKYDGPTSYVTAHAAFDVSTVLELAFKDYQLLVCKSLLVRQED